MNKKIRNSFIMFFLFILTFIFSSFTIYSYENIEVNNFADDRIIISLSNEKSKKLKDYAIDDFPELSLSKISDLTSTSKDTLRKRSGNYDYSDGVSIDRFNQTLCLYLRYTGHDKVRKAVEILSKRDDVVGVSPDYYTEQYSVIPGDTYVSSQWAIENIQLNDAWNITKGSKLSPVKVGVIDSGVQGDHPDLVDNIDTSLSADCRYTTIVQENNPTDYAGHGTMVSGVIGARGDNDKGVAGTAWYLKLISLKTVDFSNPSGQDVFIEEALSSVISAVDYSTVNNIPILNYSSGWQFSDEEDESLSNPLKIVISNYPGLFICAAGNHGTSYETRKVYPACFHLPNMIVAGASTQSNTRWSNSDYSSTMVDLFAPGENIYTTKLTSSYTNIYSGTSFAAPYVTGVATLIKSIRPQLTAEEIKKLILNNVDTYSSFSGYCVTGGRLNAYKSVRAATEQQTFFGDVDGDGYKDVIMSGQNSSGKRVLTTLLGNSNGSFTNETTFTSTRDFYYIDLAYCGDFNGDGRSDILIHWINNNYRQLLVYLGNSNGSFDEGVNLSSVRYHSLYEFPSKFLVTDVNNDGKDDFIVVYKNSSGKVGILNYKGSSTSPYILDATTNALTSNFDYFDDYKIYTGDFNGDNYQDILIPTYDSNEKRNITIFTGTSTGIFNDGQLLVSQRNHKPYRYPFSYSVGDYNGDGYTDFLNTYREDGSRKIIVYNGKSSTPYVEDAPFNNYTSLYTYSIKDYTFSGDVDGDGYDDLIIHYVNSSSKRCLRVYKGNSSNVFYYDSNTTTTNLHNEVTYPCSIYSCDVDNDGRCDVIVKWKDGTNARFYVYKGNINSTFTSAQSTSTTVSFYN